MVMSVDDSIFNEPSYLPASAQSKLNFATMAAVFSAIAAIGAMLVAILSFRSQGHALDAQAKNLGLSSSLIPPSFDFQYLLTSAQAGLPWSGPSNNLAAARPWEAPIASPDFNDGLVSPGLPDGSSNNFPNGQLVRSAADIQSYLDRPDCNCEALKARRQESGIPFHGLSYTYLGVVQLGKSPAADVRVKLRKSLPGALVFSSISAGDFFDPEATEIELLLGAMDTGQARLVPLFSWTSGGPEAPTLQAKRFKTNVGSAYVPVSLSWKSAGETRRSEVPIRSALSHPVFLTGGVEGYG